MKKLLIRLEWFAYNSVLTMWKVIDYLSKEFMAFCFLTLASTAALLLMGILFAVIWVKDFPAHVPKILYFFVWMVVYSFALCVLASASLAVRKVLDVFKSIARWYRNTDDVHPSWEMVKPKWLWKLEENRRKKIEKLWDRPKNS